MTPENRGSLPYATKAPQPREANAGATGVAVWICICAYWDSVGWILSAMHRLDRFGYVCALVFGLGLLFLFRNSIFQSPCLPNFKRFRARVRWNLPLSFAALAIMAVTGGFAHNPNMMDALAYRIPRVLHWLAEGHWYWIKTDIVRQNVRTCGFEWLMAPIIALTRDDRLVFLPNAVSFLLMPGLLFTVFTRMGVSPRVAWPWMWIIPTGYCFLLQAGGAANDMFFAPFVLAAVDFGLRAQKSGRIRDLFLSILAAAVLTGKLSNVALLLPWLIAVAPAWRLVRRRILRLVAVCLFAVLASFIPNSILNFKYCGDWSGFKIEGAGDQNPIICFAGTAALLVTQNLVPPVFPLAGAWNRWVARELPARVQDAIAANFEIAAVHLELPEMQIEDIAGLGFGVTLLLAASVFAAIRNGGKLSHAGAPAGRRRYILALNLSPYVSLFVLMSKCGLYAAARIFAPYYCLLFPALLTLPGHRRIVRSPWWKRTALGVVLIAYVLVILAPARPLGPTLLLGERSDKGRSLLDRAALVYTVYSRRADGFAPIVARLPPEAQVVGFVGAGSPESTLWKPFGSRKVQAVLESDTPADLKAERIDYIVVDPEIDTVFKEHREQWLARIHGVVVNRVPLALYAATGAVDWLIVKVDSK